MSDAAPPAYRRLIITLSHTGTDPRTLRAAAEFARLLGLHLHGVFVEDEAVLAFAELPFAREIRLPTHEWTPLGLDRLAEEFRHAAEQAHRAMDDIVDALQVPSGFEILRGDPIDSIAALCCATDIVLAAQPAGLGPVGALERLLEAAHGMPASVLLLPARQTTSTGPVVALLHDPDDPALPVAARIAATARTGLVVLLPRGPNHPDRAVADRAVGLGVPRTRVGIRHMTNGDADAAAAALGRIAVRLVVVGRSDTGVGTAAGAARVVTICRAPVLVAEPPGAAK